MLSTKTRGAVGLHLFVPEVPHLRGFILRVSHPTTDFEMNLKCIPMNNLVASVYRESYSKTQAVFHRHWVVPSSRSSVNQKCIGQNVLPLSYHASKYKNEERCTLHNSRLFGNGVGATHRTVPRPRHTTNPYVFHK